MNGRKKNVYRNLIFGLINKITMLLVPFLILSVIGKNLGPEYLGLNNLFTSLLQILSLAEMGIGSALIYEMYKPVAKEDIPKLSKILNLYKKIYNIISIIILIIGLILLPFISKLINGSIPEDINLYILFIIYLLNTFFSYSIFAYKRSILNAHQRVDVLSKINLFVNIIIYIIQLLVLIIYKNYYLYVLTIPLCTVIDNLFVNKYVKKHYPNIIPKGDIDKETKSDIVSRVKALMGHKIGAVVISSLDSIVISIFLGLNSLALYSNYFYIVKALNGIINIGFTAILSSVGNSLVLETKEHNLNLFNKLNLILSCFVGFCSICLITIFQPFITLWMGEEFLLGISSVILFAVYFYTWQIRVIGLAFKDAAGMWRDDFFKPYIGLAFNLIANIVFIHLFGLNGVIISTIVVMAFIYFPWETKVLFKKIFQCSPKKYVNKQLLHFAVTSILAILLYKISLLIKLNVILKLALILIINITVIAIVYFIMYKNTREFKEILSDVKKIIKRGDSVEKRKNKSI